MNQDASADTTESSAPRKGLSVPFVAFGYTSSGRYVEHYGHGPSARDSFVKTHADAHYRDGQGWH